MLETLEHIEKEIQPFKDELYSNLKHKVTELINNINTEILEQRLFQELAFYIDKYDIQEEISRLKCHINTLLLTLEKEEDTGKTLNFILQEMQREANTLGSKFSLLGLTYILTLKEEIENVGDSSKCCLNLYYPGVPTFYRKTLNLGFINCFSTVFGLFSLECNGRRMASALVLLPWYVASNR